MCGELKPLSEFPKRYDRPSGYKCYCKPCKSAKDRVYNTVCPSRIARSEAAFIRKVERERINLEKQEAEALAKMMRLALKPTPEQIAEKKRMKSRKWIETHPEKAAQIRKACYEKRKQTDHAGLLEIKRKSRRKRENQSAADQFFIMAAAAEEISKILPKPEP